MYHSWHVNECFCVSHLSVILFSVCLYVLFVFLCVLLYALCVLAVMDFYACCRLGCVK